MSQISLPPFLKPGDAVGITCPAGYVSYERIACAVDVLQRWGFRVVLGRTIGTGEYYFSGHDGERLLDLQTMLDDPQIRAIVMGRGGYGTSRIIDATDFSTFQQHPKWICGFSDITVLHSHILQNYGVATLHSPMCGAFSAGTEGSHYIRSLQAALTGQPLEYAFAPSSFNRDGEAEGIVVGGNLAILAHLTGSVSQVDTKGRILFIEDIGEHLYNVDRLLLNLKRSGQLAVLKGLIVGQFTDMQDTERPFGQMLEEIISEKIQDYDYPVAFNFPCGHDTENVTLPLGVTAHMKAGPEGSTLSISFT